MSCDVDNMIESPLNTTSDKSARGKENANKAKWTDNQIRIFIQVLTAEAGKCALHLQLHSIMK